MGGWLPTPSAGRGAERAPLCGARPRAGTRGRAAPTRDRESPRCDASGAQRAATSNQAARRSSDASRRPPPWRARAPRASPRAGRIGKTPSGLGKTLRRPSTERARPRARHREEAGRAQQPKAASTKRWRQQDDNNGNQTVRQGPGIIGVEQLIAYTSFDMPESITFGGNPNASRIELEYDADQTRILKRTVTTTGEKTDLYVGELYERRTSASGFEHQYLVHAGGRPIAQVSRTGTTDTKRFLHDDRLGSVEMVTSGTGTVEHSQQFGVFGTVASGAQPGGPTGVRRGFTGHEHDADLGLINMRGRVYDPALGRFLTADPIAGGGQGLNRYSYVLNNPTNLIDPSGFAPAPRPPRPPPNFGPGAIAKDGGPTTPPPPSETHADFNWYFNTSLSEFSVGAGLDVTYGGLGITYGPPGSGINDPASTDFAPSAENEHVRRPMPNPFDDLDYAVRVYGEGVQNGLLIASTTLAVVAGAAIAGPALGLGTLEGALATAATSAGTTLTGGGAIVGSGLGFAARGTADLAARAGQVHKALDPIAQAQRTTAVLRTSGGNIVAGGARDLSPVQRALLGPGEIAAKLPGAHAEVTAIQAAQRAGLTPQAMAVTRAICPQCAAVIEASGGAVTSSTTAIWPR